MGKRNKYGAYIPGVTERHDPNFFEDYLHDKNWEKCNKWLYEEACWLRRKLVRACILYNVFGLLMSAVLAFFTWIMMVPDLKPEELAALPPAQFCVDLFARLCETVPFGKPAVIAGLLLLPFIVCPVLLPLLLPLRCRRFAKKIKDSGVLTILQESKRKLQRLERDYRNYDGAYYLMILYALLGGALTGGVMIFSLGVQNFAKSLVITAVFTVLYGLIFLGIAVLVGMFVSRNAARDYNFFSWSSAISIELGEYSYSGEEEPPVQLPNEEEEAEIQRALDEVYGALEGSGKRDY